MRCATKSSSSDPDEHGHDRLAPTCASCWSRTRRSSAAWSRRSSTTCRAQRGRERRHRGRRDRGRRSRQRRRRDPRPAAAHRARASECCGPCARCRRSRSSSCSRTSRSARIVSRRSPWAHALPRQVARLRPAAGDPHRDRILATRLMLRRRGPDRTARRVGLGTRGGPSRTKAATGPLPCATDSPRRAG